MLLHVILTAKGLVARLICTLERTRSYMLRVDVPHQSSLRFEWLAAILPFAYQRSRNLISI